MTDNGDVLLTQTEDGHHKFVDAPERMTEEELMEGLNPLPPAKPADNYRKALFEAKMRFGRSGTLVQLQSGGHVMTVQGWRVGENDDLVIVVWFDGETLKRESLPYEMLKIAEQPSGTAATE